MIKGWRNDPAQVAMRERKINARENRLRAMRELEMRELQARSQFSYEIDIVSAARGLSAESI